VEEKAKLEGKTPVLILKEKNKKGDQKEKKRIEKQLGKVQNELEVSRKDFVSFTDPESRFMKKLCTKSKRGPRRIKCYGNEANLREMAEKMESPEGQEVYRVRAKTVERLFGHVKQNIGLREFLTRGLQGVRAEFSLACIAHNLKRIWTIKSQTKAIGANSIKKGRIGQSSLKKLCSSIIGVWSHILSSFSKDLGIYQL